MFGKNAVTLRDKQKAKTTAKMFLAFAGLFFVGATLLTIFTPRADTIKGIDNKQDELIKSYTTANYGENFITLGDQTFQVYSSDDATLQKSVKYTQEIKEKVSGTGVNIDSTSFGQPTVHYEATSENNGCLLIFDNYGDIFKYDVIDGNYTISDDYWLADTIKIKENTYRAKYVLRALDIDTTTQELYILTNFDGKFCVCKYDLNDLSSGIKQRKYLYSYLKPEDQSLRRDYYAVDPVTQNDSQNPYNISVSNDYVYIYTTRGLNRWSKDLLDNTSDETNPINFLNDGLTYFASKMKEELLDSENASKLTENGLTSADITNASEFVINTVYKTIFGDTKYYEKETDCALEFKTNNDWVKDYKPSQSSNSLIVKKTAFDAKKTLFVNSGETQTLGGACFSRDFNSLYYLDTKSNTLFYVNVNRFSDFAIDDDRTLETESTKSSVAYKGETFYENRTNISYDKYAKSIHVTFYTSNKVSVVDITEEGLELRYTFKMKYDIRSFAENKAKDRFAFMYQTDKRTIKNVTSHPMCIDIVNPNTYRYRGVFVAFDIVCVCLFGAALITALIALRATRKETSLLKLKVIKRDFKRNKWTYVALIPFVAFLIMFCYVEAVGSISFSFFSYTLEKPTYLWNTFGNYIQIFNEKYFWRMIGNTLFFLVFDLFLGIVPPIIFAFCLSIIKNKKLSGVLRALMFIPGIVPGIATLLIWRIGIYGDTGILNQLVCLFRYGSTSHSDFTPISFLRDESISRWSLLLMGFPYVGGYLIFYGGLMNIPKEYDEACQLEGLGVIKRFLKIDLPLIKPQIKYIFIMGILSSVQNYERTYMLASNGTTTLVENMYRQMKEYNNYGLASAYATIIFLLLIIPVFLNFRKTRKDTMGDML